jgi:hypothetical protein
MTMKREAKSEIQAAATSGAPIITSPAARKIYGRFYPESIARRMRVEDIRNHRNYGRTREMVVSEKIKARRPAGRVRVA